MLAGLSVSGTAALWLAFRLGLQPADRFGANRSLDTAGAAILAAGAAAGVAGVLALVRHDRSWMVLAATLVGVLVTALMLQQVVEGLGWIAS